MAEKMTPSERLAFELERACDILKQGLYENDPWAEEMLERWYALVPEDFKREWLEKGHG